MTYRSRISDLFAYYTVDENGCWIWNGAVNWCGYGINMRAGKAKRMHREYYKHFKGPIPDGMHVCHRCDVRRCVNPDHLFLGTNADNMADKVSKGRQTRGAASKSAKLNERQVIEIRRDPRPIQEIARDYGIVHSAISAIKLLKKWKHVPETGDAK